MINLLPLWRPDPRRHPLRVAMMLMLGLALLTPTLARAQSVPSFEERPPSPVIEALQGSLRLVSMQHGLRVAFEGKTRAELGGSFLGDYRRSLRVPGQWTDGDSFVTNYIGHPIQGAASGFVWLEAGGREARRRDGADSILASRLRAAAWAAGYSLQFELGPLSEASIGNVGLRPETAGWVDHVVTPVGGFMVMLGEDALDRFILTRLERRTGSPVVRALLRLALNPSRSSANVALMRAPWHRANRPL